MKSFNNTQITKRIIILPNQFNKSSLHHDIVNDLIYRDIWVSTNQVPNIQMRNVIGFFESDDIVSGLLFKGTSAPVNFSEFLKIESCKFLFVLDEIYKFGEILFDKGFNAERPRYSTFWEISKGGKNKVLVENLIKERFIEPCFEGEPLITSRYLLTGKGEIALSVFNRREKAVHLTLYNLFSSSGLFVE